ncbi:GNAT family N-acetyltransferase [Alteromonas sp. a30]|uniref:GNAT family N-acetyltransferase n=1 Tax=Alteromonas sp. a30 TaxID=2730917 RepID=UPI00227EFC17|nr:GNAT family N-acetyltransferase [Alteromonas sp. a30]MCY7295229.1 GNAT family N-acetyltransferase [Alteromonas sp. a30]
MTNESTHYLSHQAFFNSLLLETDLGDVVTQSTGSKVLVQITNGKTLHLPLAYLSPAKRHRYTGECWLSDNAVNQGEPKRIDFVTAINLVMQHHFDDIDMAEKDRFLTRVSASDAYVKRAEAFRLNPKDVPNRNAFIESEQSLTGGHSMHPAPKSCEPLSEDEQRQYLPEFGQHFAIQWFAVQRSHLTGDAVKGDLASTLTHFFNEQVPAQAQQELTALGDDWLPLPMHPLQARAWLASEDAQALTDVVKPLSITSEGWTGTSSSRAIYHPHSEWMLKVSFPVKLTNSLRLMSAGEANRGIQFSKLLQTPAGIELKQRLPDTVFVEEPVWASITNHQGESIDLSLVCFRENCFKEAAESPSESNQKSLAQSSYLLASANQVSAANAQTQVGRWVSAFAKEAKMTPLAAAKSWVAQFMDKVIHPLCIARSDYGIVLLAHQQNVLLNIQKNQPVGVIIRDCQGMGLTDTALIRFKEVFDKEDAEYFMTAQALNPYQNYYVVGNTLLNTLSAIAADLQVEEAELWQLCQSKLDKWRLARPQDISFYDYMLDSPKISWKRNFYCFAGNLNENTLPDPAQIYCQIENPLHLEIETTRVYKTLPDKREIVIKDTFSSNDALSFTFSELGQKPVNFEASKTGNQVTLSSAEPINDAMLCCAAMEHALYSTKAEHISLHALSTSDLQSLETFYLGVTQHASLTLAQFVESSPTWLRKPVEMQATEEVTASNGITHPIRPSKPKGVIFERYFYHLNRTLTLRVLDIERDLHCFNYWHNVPETAKVWELEGALQSHREYLQKQADDAHQYCVIGEFDGVPFGYFEVYWAPEDRLGPHYQCENFDRGVHILVGNMAFRGSIYFDTWAKAIIQFCFQDDPRTNNVMGEPNAANHRVVAITERVGMEKQYEFDFPHKRAALLQCKRARFFQQFAI